MTLVQDVGSDRPIFYSHQTGPDRVPHSDRTAGVDFAAPRTLRGFLDALRCLGHRPVEILRPEIYPRQFDRVARFGRETPIHLIFKGPEDIRILKGAYNIGVIDWNDTVIADRVSNDRPFSNHLRMFRLLDEIWVGSGFLQRVFQDAGLANTRVVPSPITLDPEPTPSLDVLEGLSARCFLGPPETSKYDFAVMPLSDVLAGDSQGGDVVFSVFETLDWRSGLSALIEGWLAAGDDRSRHLLLLCSDTPIRALVEQEVAGSARRTDTRPLAQIAIVEGDLTPRQKSALYRRASFYLCTSRLEGYNKPLLESMAAGVTPVTVAHSAMSDFVDPNDTLTIATTRKRFRLDGTAGTTNRLAEQAALDSVAQAIRSALSLDRSAREARRTAATRVIADRFSVEAVAPIVEERLRWVRHATPNV